MPTHSVADTMSHAGTNPKADSSANSVADTGTDTGPHLFSYA